MNEDSSLLERMVRWLIFAIIAIAAIKVAFWLAGAVMGLAFFLLFTVVPLAVVGWIIVKLFRVLFRRDDDYRPA
jgi:archaellum biogenesis protein FlaJ (TadC family)